jgi:hypothetical protein
MTIERIATLALRRLILFLMLSLGIALADSPDCIPNVDGKSLNGERVQLPKDLHGSNAILIVSFTRKSGEQSRRWGLEVSKMTACDGQPVQWYELPVLSDVPRLVRPLALRAMRSGLTPEFRSHFVPIYANPEAWKRSVNFSVPDDAYIALINKSGQVEHLWHGAFDKSRGSELKELFCAAIRKSAPATQ